MKGILNKKTLALVFLLLLLPLLVGCFPPKNQAPIITSTPIILAEVDELYTYDVEATDPDGDILTYSLDIKPKGMAINSATGLIEWTPTAEGDYAVVVKVSDGALDITQSFTIVVIEEEGPGWTPTPPAPPAVKLTSIVVVPKTITLFVGESETIDSVTAHYSNGTKAEVELGDCTYTYTPVPALTDIVIIIDSNGLVTAVAEGTSTVTVSYKGKTDTVEITVNPVLLTSIVVLPETMTLLVGGEKTITSVIANYNDESTKDIALEDCDYALLTTSDKKVVTVSDGVVEAVGSGTAHIVVSYTEDGITVKDGIAVTVNPALLTSIVVDPKEMTLFVGESEVIKSVTAYYSDGTTFVIDQQGNDYGNGSDDNSVATVSASHVVTAVAKGTATITVMYEDKTDTIAVTVKAILLDHIEVDPKSMTLFVGEIEFFKVIAHYNFGPTKNVTNDCVYVSNDTNIAKVLLLGPNDLQKSVKAVVEGTAKITVSYTEGAVTKIDEIIVKVNPVLLTAIVVEPDTMTLFVGESDTIDSVTAHYNFGPTKDVDLAECEIAYTPSSFTEIIALEGNNKIKAIAVGTDGVDVSYTEGSITKTDYIMVTVAPLAVGDSYGGGIVAYILADGDTGYDADVQHGLIAAAEDQSSKPGAKWGCKGIEIEGADGTAVGTGNQNTIHIMEGCSTAGTAADICTNLTLGVYNDWFLPSIDELKKLFTNRDAIGGFGDDYYWSSSEYDKDCAWYQHFRIGGGTRKLGKHKFLRVRAVRAF